MSKRRKIQDRFNAGPSALVPYIEYEPPRERHHRRKTFNLDHIATARALLSQIGYSLEIKNEGHHWIMTCGRDVWEWWPSSAKLVYTKQWRRGIHCHDIEQVITQMKRRKSK